MSKPAKKAQKQKTKVREARLSNPLFQHILPLTLKTQNHKDFYQSLCQGDDAVVYGVAGTAKTYISLYYALSELNKKNVDRIIILRSAVATRDIGFLPGSDIEKMNVFESPYQTIVNQVLSRGDAYEILKKTNELNFMSTSYLRGVTFDNAIVIVDECQNLTFHEIDTIYTRTGENTQVIFAGDLIQLDEGVGKTGSGFLQLVKTAEQLQHFSTFEFGIEDIVRSEKVKRWIIATSLNRK